MATVESSMKTQIKSLLVQALPNENLNDYKIEIIGTSDKCDGYIADIYFVNLTSTKQNYNLVLKCGKSSEILRKNVPIKEASDGEIYMYSTVFPAFRKFEIEHKIEQVFDAIPICHGTFSSQGTEVIVFENLKAMNYKLWDAKLPLPREYIEDGLRQYGKWHAISAAIQDQQPEIFNEITGKMLDVWDALCDKGNLPKVFSSGVESAVKTWENNIDDGILNEWRSLQERAGFYIKNLRKKSKSLNVIIHGDCWNNNYMFKEFTDLSGSKGVKVVMLDWQMSKVSSPVIDVSDFLYCLVSEEDLKDFDDLLKIYYGSFAEYLRKLGSDPDTIYTYFDFLNDWKVYGRYGIIRSVNVFRVVYAEQDDIRDIVEVVENGEDMGNTFCPNIKYVDLFRQRSKCILQHAVERELIKPIENFLY